VRMTATPAIGEAKTQARAGQQVSVECLGYRGRETIHELLMASDEIKAMTVARSRAPRILRRARREGMTTLVQDGITKVLAGITDLRQVKAVAVR